MDIHRIRIRSHGSDRLPASSVGDSLDAPTVLDPSPRASAIQMSSKQVLDVQSLMLPPLSKSPPKPALEPPNSLEKDLEMDASTLELFLSGKLDEYDTLRSVRVLSHIPTPSTSPVPNRVQELVSAEQVEETPIEDVNASDPLALPPLTLSERRISDTLHLSCVLEQQAEDDAFVEALMKEREQSEYMNPAVSPVLSYASPNPLAASVLPPSMKSEVKKKVSPVSPAVITTVTEMPSMDPRTSPSAPSLIPAISPTVSSRTPIIAPVIPPINSGTSSGSSTYIPTDKAQLSMISPRKQLELRNRAVNAANYNFSDDDGDSSDTTASHLSNSSITQLSYHSSARASQLFHDHEDVTTETEIISHERVTTGTVMGSGPGLSNHDTTEHSRTPRRVRTVSELERELERELSERIRQFSYHICSTNT